MGGLEEDLRGRKPQESRGRGMWVKSLDPASESATEVGSSRWSADAKPGEVL